MRISSGFVAALLASIAAGAAPGDQPPLPSKKTSSSSPSPSPAAAAAAAAVAAPIDGKTLTKEKLQALPDDAVVQVTGKTYTARELRALAARSAPSRSSVSKVLDQSVSIVVVRKDGMSSAPKSVPFTAAREVTMPPFPYRLLKCAKDVTHDQCGVFDLFWGDHVEHTLVEKGGAGCDQFEVTAKPPWEFDHFHMWKDNKGGSVGDAPAGRHGDVLRWNVCWSVRGDGPYSGNQASYTGYMLVKGPKGFPLD